MTRRPIAVAVVSLVALGSACALRQPPSSAVSGAEEVGLYRAHWRSDAERGRQFRLLLYAALPDRLHGEVLTPLGSTELIIDGGGGQLAVTLSGERTSYVGPASAGALERILGVHLTLDELVSGLLSGETASGSWSVERSASAAGKLPAAVEFHTEEAQLTLELKRTRPLRTDASLLGRGVPPPGMRQRPLDEMSLPSIGERLADAD